MFSYVVCLSYQNTPPPSSSSSSSSLLSIFMSGRSHQTNVDCCFRFLHTKTQTHTRNIKRASTSNPSPLIQTKTPLYHSPFSTRLYPLSFSIHGGWGGGRKTCTCIYLIEAYVALAISPTHPPTIPPSLTLLWIQSVTVPSVTGPTTRQDLATWPFCKHQ